MEWKPMGKFAELLESEPVVSNVLQPTHAWGFGSARTMKEWTPAGQNVSIPTDWWKSNKHYTPEG